MAISYKWSNIPTNATASSGSIVKALIDISDSAMPSSSFPDSTRVYDQRILNHPSVEKITSNTLFGITGFTQYEIEVDNLDGTFNSDNFQDAFVRTQFIDSSGVIKSIYGKVTEWSLGFSLFLTIEDIEIEAFNTQFPSRIINVTDYSNASQQALGQPIPVCFGRVVRLPLLNINIDDSAKEYDWFICEGAGLSAGINDVTNVYKEDSLLDTITGTADAGTSTTITLESADSRPNDWYNNFWVDITAGTGSGQIKYITDYVSSTNIATVDSAWSTTPDATSVYRLREYRVYDGTQGSPYSGIAFIRLKKNFSQNGSINQLYADIDALQDEKNYAKAIRSILTNTTWGLSLTINNSNFATAEALSAINSMNCEGAINKQGLVIDYLKQLMEVRDMALSGGVSGLEISVDQAKTSQGTFGLGDTGGLNNIKTDRPQIVSLHPRDRVKNLKVNYRKNYKDDNFMHEIERAANLNGIDKGINLNFAYTHDTADRICDYKRKRLIGQTKQIRGLEVSDSIKAIEKGQSITIDIPASRSTGLEFNGTSTTINCGIPTIAENIYALECQFKLNALPSTTGFEFFIVFNNKKFQLSIHNSDDKLRLWDSNAGAARITEEVLTTNRWYHAFVFISNGTSNNEVWLDGELVLENFAYDDVDDLGSILIGSNAISAGWFDGWIREVRHWGCDTNPTAMTQSEVQALNVQNLPTTVRPTNILTLRSYWRIDEGTGTTANDTGDDGANDGTITDGTWSVGDGEDYELIGKSASDIDSQYILDLILYNHAYTYSAGTLPSDETQSIPADTRFTIPDPVSNLASVHSFETVNNTIAAFVILTWDLPEQIAVEALVSLKKSTDAVTEWKEIGKGINSYRIDGLTPGIEYDLRVEALNNTSSPSLKSTASTLTNELSGGDSSAPSTPSGLTGVNKFGQLSWEWTRLSDVTVELYIIEVYTASSGGTLVYTEEILQPKNSSDKPRSKPFIAQAGSLTTNVTRYAQVKAIDFSGNESSFTSRTSSQTDDILKDDIQDGEITARSESTFDNVTPSNGSDIDSVSITTDGGDVKIRYSLTIDNNEATIAPNCRFSVQRGGSDVDADNITVVVLAGTEERITGLYVDRPSSGTYTYQIEYDGINFNGKFNDGLFTAEAMKR